MWRPWGNKSTVRIHSSSSSSSPSPSPSSPSLFSCSSFKDIQSLCLDESPQQQQQQQQQQHQLHQPQQQQQQQQPHHQIAPSATKKSTVFHRVRLANSLIRTWSTHQQTQPQPHQNHHHHHQHPPPKSPSLPRSFSQPVPEHDLIPEPSTEPCTEPCAEPTPFIQGAEQRVVVYYTSLRVVRSTFEACKSVLSILQSFRINLDERDVSMDAGFLTELSKVMGQPGLTLPCVFIAGRYVGGFEEVSKMNETGELKKVLEGLPKSEPGECCYVCGGYRFVLCSHCDGSRKVYTEKGGFRTCGNCNENGLLRCPSCFTAPKMS